jgi:hypothetical protein
MTKSRRIEREGYVARMEKKKNAHRILVGKSEVKRPLRTLRSRWKDNIKRELIEIGYGWTGLIWLRTGTCGGIL